jgi:hypothetical protein
MSETAGTESVGVTGEVDTSATGASDAGTTAEDQAAEEQLHGIMQDEDPAELKKQLERWRKTAQRHERTARDNSAAAARLRELEDASKSEVQRAVDAQQAAERERDAVRSQHARTVAAASHGLDPELADYLGDGTEDEISDRAKSLSDLIEKTAQKLAEQMTSQNNGGGRGSGGTRTRPVESMRPGAAPAGSRAASSNNDLFRQLMTGGQE